MVQNLGKQFHGEVLFEGANFQISKGDRVGLSGRNGSGKSTLLKILAGIVKPTVSIVLAEGDVSVGYLEQSFETQKRNSLWEEIHSAFVRIIELKKE